MGDQVRGNKIVNHYGTPRRPPRVVLLTAADPLSAADLRTATDPRTAARLGLDKEHRAISRAIDAAGAGDRLTVRTSLALRYGDLRRELLRNPAVVHFSGHGTRSGAIVLAGEDGHPQSVPPRILGDLFRIANSRGTLRCVVLNACWSQAQAFEIARHVPCVVGMSGRLPDGDAIRYAEAFYETVAAGRDVACGHDMGVNALDLDGGDVRLPVLMQQRPGVAGRTLVVD